MIALADQPVTQYCTLTPATCGRRVRVFARCVNLREGGIGFFSRVVTIPPGTLMAFTEPISYGELMTAIDLGSAWQQERAALDRLPLRQKYCDDPEIPELLQDLADSFNADLHDACAALDDPDLYYPGVDPPLIEPVHDDHVHTVIAALQRELNREVRHGPHGGVLPAAPLKQLPWHVQRALVERRRLRFAEWGIGLREFETGYWSLWRVQEDPDWCPR